MSILGTLFSKILGHATAPVTPTPGPAPITPSAAPSPASATPPAAAPPVPAVPSPTASAPPAAPMIPRMDEVDVGKLLDGLAAKNSTKLDWRHSIVDLMKLLGMESSFGERKALAGELGYVGDTTDSAKMNIWLHAQVFERLAANGGKVPADLQH